MRAGFGGETMTLHDLTNRDRVNNCRALLGTAAGRAAYVSRVLTPLLHAVGRHPALLGFLIINEGYSLVQKEDALGILTRSADVTVPLRELQAFVNVVAARIKRVLPGALCSASLKLRMNSRWNERQGIGGLGTWYEDDKLIAAGGEKDGTLDLRQYQCTSAPVHNPSKNL